jgi:chemotaxis protein MotB
MSHPKRRGKGHGAEFHVDERWLVSYADMVTVLMCLFIVLYAMSTVDQDKYTKLKNSLATGFGVTNSDTVDTAEGIVVPAELVDQDAEGFTAAELAAQEVAHLEALENQVSAALAAAGVSAQATFTIDSRGLTIGLVGSATYFTGNSDKLRSEAQAVLDSIGPVIGPLPNLITVEGHADPKGSPAPFASDWDLASARAISVLQYLVSHGGVGQTRISSISFGSTNPSGASADQNRRVDIVVHTGVSQDVAALIPQVLADGAPATTTPATDLAPAVTNPATPTTETTASATTTESESSSADHATTTSEGH